MLFEHLHGLPLLPLIVLQLLSILLFDGLFLPLLLQFLLLSHDQFFLHLPHYQGFALLLSLFLCSLTLLEGLLVLKEGSAACLDLRVEKSLLLEVNLQLDLLEPLSLFLEVPISHAEHGLDLLNVE